MFDSKTLKPGDDVVIQPGCFYGKPRLVRIASITPSGIVKVEGSSSTFRADGRERGCKGGFYRPDRLEYVTDQLRASIRRNTLIDKFRNVQWEKLTDAQLEAVALAVDGEKVQVTR